MSGKNFIIQCIAMYDLPSEYTQAFYAEMGCFFASKNIRKEIGEPMSNDENYVWWLVRDKRNNFIVGFSALEINKQKAKFRSSYVLSHYRNQGVYDSLIKEKISWAKQNNILEIKTVASPVASSICAKNGFAEYNKRGKYSLMIYETG